MKKQYNGECARPHSARHFDFTFWGATGKLAVADTVEEIGLDDGLTALTQMGLLKAA
jgi:hypothetical protein